MKDKCSLCGNEAILASSASSTSAPTPMQCRNMPWSVFNLFAISMGLPPSSDFPVEVVIWEIWKYVNLWYPYWFLTDEVSSWSSIIFKISNQTSSQGRILGRIHVYKNEQLLDWPFTCLLLESLIIKTSNYLQVKDHGPWTEQQWWHQILCVCVGGGSREQNAFLRRQKSQFFFKNGWFWQFFSSDGGKLGAEPPTEGVNAPMSLLMLPLPSNC